MCGLAGILTREAAITADLNGAVGRMIEPIRHRGPDDSGIWADARAGVALGFRRLAIIDLSEHGHQPMLSESGRYVLLFNGEIYNHRTLRAELEGKGHRFRGHSDTEVLLAAFEAWGIEKTIARLVGMFAIALWDAERRHLHLIRDRLGIKPLFVSGSSATITFGSELKALQSGPGFDRTVDREAVASYLKYLYVPAPRSVFSHVRKLPPGHILTFERPEWPPPDPVPYWNLVEHARAGRANPMEEPEEAILDEAERLLSSAVGLRLQSDVPLGALLSGGIDSSLIVALMQELNTAPVRTYSVAFEEEEYNEAPAAARIAAHLGTDHTEVTLTPQDALDVIPRLPEIFDEPFASPSAIPNLLICGVARREVTVALSGTGGDEVFAGYNRYRSGARLIGRLLGVPRPARLAVARALGAVSQESWDRLGRSALFPNRLRYRYFGRKMGKLAVLMKQDTPVAMYRSLVSAWQSPEEAMQSGAAVPHPLDNTLTGMSRRESADLIDAMLMADQLGYLADDQLAKVDRVSMAVSLELRVPLLDHRLVEFSWSLPEHMKIRGPEGKWILRKLLYRRIPPALVDRPKMGLSVPLERWLRGPLRDWAETLLNRDRLLASGLRPEAVRAEWTRFLDGQGGLDLAIWAVLMYSAWAERWLHES
jgi:asparagine synthase (glutamine-hydrolysing)